MARLDDPGVAGLLAAAGIGLPGSSRAAPAEVAGVAGWEQIEASGARGVAALQLVIDNLRPVPLVEGLYVVPGERVRLSEFSEPRQLPGYLHIAYRAPDAYDPQRPGHRQQFRVTLPDLWAYGIEEGGPAEWAAWLCWVLTYLAAHEVAEFFVVGGVRLFDPHAKDAVPIVDLPPPPPMLRERMRQP